MYDYAVFIGRFQPLHLGHIQVINQALQQAKNLIILIGSSNVARSPRNPFTFEERKNMIFNAMHDGSIQKDWDRKIYIEPLPDSTYNDAAWVGNVQKGVRSVTQFNLNAKIALAGYGKDSSSYYLKLFPEWDSIQVDTQYGTVNATQIRDAFLQELPIIPQSHILASSTQQFFKEFFQKDQFKWLQAEAKFYRDYKESWKNVPYPVFITCVDAVVEQSGHILLVERKNSPGKGLLALPGGHVNPSEAFRAAAIRELKEETQIADHKGTIPPAMLDSFIINTRLFDDPNRSQRGRVITQAYHFKCPNRTELFHVKGDDDAASAQWYELGTIRYKDMYEDHAAIIESMLGVTLT